MNTKELLVFFTKCRGFTIFYDTETNLIKLEYKAKAKKNNKFLVCYIHSDRTKIYLNFYTKEEEGKVTLADKVLETAVMRETCTEYYLKRLFISQIRLYLNEGTTMKTTYSIKEKETWDLINTVIGTNLKVIVTLVESIKLKERKVIIDAKTRHIGRKRLDIVYDSEHVSNYIVREQKSSAYREYIEKIQLETI